MTSNNLGFSVVDLEPVKIIDIDGGLLVDDHGIEKNIVFMVTPADDTDFIAFFKAVN